MVFTVDIYYLQAESDMIKHQIFHVTARQSWCADALSTEKIQKILHFLKNKMTVMWKKMNGHLSDDVFSFAVILK